MHTEEELAVAIIDQAVPDNRSVIQVTIERLQYRDIDLKTIAIKGMDFSFSPHTISPDTVKKKADSSRPSKSGTDLCPHFCALPTTSASRKSGIAGPKPQPKRTTGEQQHAPSSRKGGTTILGTLIEDLILDLGLEGVLCPEEDRIGDGDGVVPSDLVPAADAQELHDILGGIDEPCDDPNEEAASISDRLRVCGGVKCSSRWGGGAMW